MLSGQNQEWAKAAGLRFVTGAGPGIARKRRGKGFVYVGADLKPVRDAVTLKRIHSLVIPPAWEQVWICPTENGHIQAVGRDAKGRKQYRYHPRYREFRDETKFHRMASFGAALPRIRRRVRKDLALPGLPKLKVLAAIVRLMDETCIRVGNEEYAKANQSFGLTTLRNRHVEIEGPTVHFRFRGKSKQEHDVMLRDKRLARIVKRCQDLPGQELFQYQEEGGRPVGIESNDVNDYLREIAHEDFTAKDFRTWHGTGHMAAQLAALGLAESETAAKRNIVAAVKETAKHLGNRPAACRKYYVHPAVFESYSDASLSSYLTNHQKEGSRPSGLRREEVAILQMIETYASKRRRAQRAAA